MINLSTGLPGAGKTLFTINYVEQLAKSEHRPVFFSGIKDLQLDWHEIDAEKWMDCPEGSIIVIDECQRIFRPAGAGAKVPEYISGLETHRHKGHDIFLVTQHPMLMNANVRRLTERHWHISRRFGMHRATIFEFQSCKDQPLANTRDAKRMDWKYPKEVFHYYKSAEVHTVKRRLPYQYAVIAIAPILAIAAIWYFVNRHYRDGQVVIPGSEKAIPTAPAPGGVSVQSVPVDGERAKPMTVKEYVESYKPRIDGLAYSAPIYDKVTQPKEAPVPVACINSKSKGCKCYSQQATVLDMSKDLCMQIVENGFFEAFPRNSDRVALASGASEARPEANATPSQQRPSTFVLPSQPSGQVAALAPVSKP